MELSGKVALVTGGAKRLGRDIALGLAGQGCDVVVHFGLSRREAINTTEEIADLGVRSMALPAELSKTEQIEDLFVSLDREFGRLDVLVNSAASFLKSPFESIALEEWDRTMAINLRAPFLCSQLAAKAMKRSSREELVQGHIVNIGDLSGLQVWPYHAHHGVSKAGLMHLTRAMALELAPEIRVNSVVPGAILPPAGQPGGQEEENEEWMKTGERLPLKRVGDTSHVVQSVLYLCANDFITGAQLIVDGGERLIGPSHRS